MDEARDGRLIVGCGDIGLRLARRLRDRGLACTGLVRSATRAAQLQAQGIAARAIDLDDDPSTLPDATQVWWFAPPPTEGESDPRLRRWLASAPRVQRIVYLSTSAVYGDCAGQWIDEDAALRPQTARGRRRLDAEQALRAFVAASATELVILRVPGIYGPGRLPRERLQRGLPVIREDECPWTNRIHAEDLAQAALAAMDRGRPGAAYNVCDGQPTTMTDYFTRCAALLGLPAPPRVSMDQARVQLTAAMLSFLEESKRLRNQRLLGELGVVLRYPDLAAGLPSCLD